MLSRPKTKARFNFSSLKFKITGIQVGQVGVEKVHRHDDRVGFCASYSFLPPFCVPHQGHRAELPAEMGLDDEKKVLFGCVSTGTHGASWVG